MNTFSLISVFKVDKVSIKLYGCKFLHKAKNLKIPIDTVHFQFYKYWPTSEYILYIDIIEGNTINRKQMSIANQTLEIEYNNTNINLRHILYTSFLFL